MTMLPDVIFVGLFAIVGPAIDHAVQWPAHRRLSAADPAWARRWLWRSAIANPWWLVAVGAALWVAGGRSWASLGFSVPDGWRSWAALALVALLAAYHAWAIVSLVRSPEARASLRERLGALSAVLPHTRAELYWFGAVSLTAGFCEEFLYRGYLIHALAPWLGSWGAAALSVVLFAAGHAYQGWNGALRSGAVGALFTVVVVVLGSLWPAIVLHFLLDLGMGIIAWTALREAGPTGSIATAPAPPAPAPSDLRR
jgi:membrane protease YdiL (CAAX protease family)